VPSQEFLNTVILLVAGVFFFAFFYSTAASWLRGHRTQRWLKFFLAAQRARSANQFGDARRLLYKAWLLSRGRGWNRRLCQLTLGEFAELLRAGGKYRRAEKMRRRIDVNSTSRVQMLAADASERYKIFRI